MAESSGGKSLIGVRETPSLSRTGVPGRLLWRPNEWGKDEVDASIRAKLRLGAPRIPPKNRRWALTGPKCLVWRAVGREPRQFIIETWFLEVVCFISRSPGQHFQHMHEFSIPSYTHRPVSNSVVCWWSPNMHILKKLRRYPECPYLMQKALRGKIYYDNSKGEKRKNGFKRH